MINMTTCPQNTLDISGNAVIGSGFAGSNTAPSNGLLVEGDMGIGTASPGSKLEIVSNGSTSSTSALDVQDNGNNSLLFVRDDGFVGVQTNSFLTNPNTGNIRTDEFQVNGSAFNLGGWNSPSDMRIKDDTSSIENPIQKISQLSGITYYYDTMHSKTKGLNFPRDKQAGIIAQELKEVLPEAVGGSKKGLYKVNYDQIIPLLIETNKAQQGQIEDQKEKLQNQQAEIERLKAKTQKVEKLEQQMEKLSNQLEQLKGDEKAANRFKNNSSENLNERTVAIGDEDAEQQAMLLQNRPNPYSNETVIPYYLPKDVQNANLLITNTQGQMLKRIPLEQTGKGELTLKTQDLKKGQYQYTLIVDGRKVKTRKMLIK